VLTHVINRSGFAEALSKRCEALSMNGEPFCLLLINLDRFKSVNSAYGHHTGDAVLRRVAQRLKVALREGDILARLNGDEFAIIASEAHTDMGPHGEVENTGEKIAERVIELISRPCVVDGNVAEIGASIGIVNASYASSTPGELNSHADLALRAAKADGRSCYRVYLPELSEALEQRTRLEKDLRSACTKDAFHLNFQPIFDTLSGRVVGAEALLRWHCEERGNVSPAEFVPIAEELGLVSRMGASVLQKACNEAATWPREVSISVNVSPIQLLDPRFPMTVKKALQESGLESARLELEITETALFGNDELAMRTLGQITQMGVRISLDDFGTGYSSMSYLHRFPISKIKIDRSFVCQLPHDEGSAAIVGAIAQFAKSLNLQITSEGIETQAQRAFLTKHGSDNLQGYLLGKPMTAAQFRGLVSPQASVSLRSAG
jgi:diguanylate cyclase (GGDEF)-like protein